jgi:hypothetical protein
MKNKKYFMAHYVAQFVPGMYTYEDEYEMFYAESKDAIKNYLAQILGTRLMLAEVKKATWAQKRYAKKYPISVTEI